VIRYAGILPAVIRVLATPEPTKTLMTYFSESSSEIDWVEEFFYASLPAGENWDDWRDRQIFLFGDDHDGFLKVLDGFHDR